MGIHQRSLNIPWALEPVEEALWPDMVPIPMKAGEVLFFTAPWCIAVLQIGAVKLEWQSITTYIQRHIPFVIFIRDQRRETIVFEMYSVTPDFYYSEDFESRPDPSKYPLLETMPLSLGQYPDKFNHLLSKST